MKKQRFSRPDRNDRREERLRPSRYLGYDRDELGMYLLSRGALEIAETQFRRAYWLNPYEPRFLCHLAWCLYQQGRCREAKEYFDRLSRDFIQTNEEARLIGQRIETKLGNKETES